MATEIRQASSEKFKALPEAIRKEWDTRSKAYSIAKQSLTGQYKGRLNDPEYMALKGELVNGLQTWAVANGVYEVVTDAQKSVEFKTAITEAINNFEMFNADYQDLLVTLINKYRIKLGKTALSKDKIDNLLKNGA